MFECFVFRYDCVSHWMVDTEVRYGKKVARNCNMCLERGKKDYMAVNMCSKCDVPLHPKCFMAYHVPTAPRPK